MTQSSNDNAIQYRLKEMTQTYEMTMKYISLPEEEVSHDHGYSDDLQPCCSDGGYDQYSFGGL
jgi:hypothetical protein